MKNTTQGHVFLWGERKGTKGLNDTV